MLVHDLKVGDIVVEIDDAECEVIFLDPSHSGDGAIVVRAVSDPAVLYSYFPDGRYVPSGEVRIRKKPPKARDVWINVYLHNDELSAGAAYPSRHEAITARRPVISPLVGRVKVRLVEGQFDE